MPGSKTPAARQQGQQQRSGGYPARGGARNVLKTNDESRAVDPEQGFEGERRGEIHRCRKEGDIGS